MLITCNLKICKAQIKLLHLSNIKIYTMAEIIKYKKWVIEKQHLTFLSSSVMDEYVKETNPSKKDIKILLGILE